MPGNTNTPKRKAPTRAKKKQSGTRASASGGTATIKSAFKPMSLATLRQHARAHTPPYRVILAAQT